MKDFNILVLEGGFNEEHQISLETGKQVKKTLNELDINFDSLLVDPKTFLKDIQKFDRSYICFNSLHGTFGEDGKIQKILEDLSYKFTHSNYKSSKISFDKELTKKEIINCSIRTPESINLKIDELRLDIFNNFYSNYGQFIIKPVGSGSSFGIKIFKDRQSINLFMSDLENNLGFYKNHKELMIEKFIKGRELTVSVIEEDNHSRSIEVTEIIYAGSDFFDYKSKYTPGYSEHILPAKIPKDIYLMAMNYAKIVHDKLLCRAISRSDFIFDGKDLFFLEINTQPGLTPISLVPEQLKYHDISFKDLIKNIIKCSI